MSEDPIVVGTDGSPRAEFAVDRAGDLAQALGASVHVVCVPGAIEGKDWPARITAQQIVADAEAKLRGRGLTVQTHLPKGDASLALVAVAESVGAQMLVVGNKGMTGIGRVLGSLPNRVSHEARCNVLIVPTKSRSLPEFGGGSIVVGVGGSNRAAPALKEAIRLAKALAADLHIVASADPPDSPDAVLAAAGAQAAEAGVTTTSHAPHDDPADALRAVAEEHDAAIIVVGNKGMHAEERERFGNIPDRLSHTAASGVLIVSGARIESEEAAVSEVALEGAGSFGEASGG
jgi:nucleotide-binding universal stress UspA family protein